MKDGAAALNQLRAAYADREAEARRRHAAGQKVVGYFSANIPEELIIAAGVFPVRLSGNPRDSTELGDRYMEDFFDGDIRSIFDRVLRGQFDFVDLLVIPRTSEGMLQLYYFLQEAARWEPKRKLPPLYLFDLLQTDNDLTRRYVRGRMDDLRRHLEQLSGAPVTDAAIAGAIGSVNRSRCLLQQANALRRRDLPLLSGGDMLRLAGSSWFIDKDEHRRHLEKLLGDPPAPLPAAPRLMVKGSPLDNAAFYDLVEDCGAVIVADDHGWGERNFAHPVETGPDPMESLTAHYHLHSPSPRQYPQSRQDEIFLALVREARVAGVIFYIEEHDDTLGWDYPAQKAALDAMKVPSLYLTHQSYRAPDEAAQRAAVAAFVASLAGQP